MSRLMGSKSATSAAHGHWHSRDESVGSTIQTICQACGKKIVRRHGDKCSKKLQQMYRDGLI